MAIPYELLRIILPKALELYVEWQRANPDQPELTDEIAIATLVMNGQAEVDARRNWVPVHPFKRPGTV